MSANQPTRDEIARAIFIVNDWSLGQFYVFEHPYNRDLTPKYLDNLERQTRIALDYSSALTNDGRRIAIEILDRINAERERRSEAEERKARKLAAKRKAESRAGYVYLVQSPTSAYKIGRTVNPDNRLKTFGVLLPFEVEYVCVVKTDDMVQLENRLHQRFASKRLQGEWFRLEASDVEYIKSLAERAS